MIVTEQPVNLFLPSSRVKRSDGVHVSSIIRGLAIDGGILKKEQAEEVSLVDFREITDPDQILRMCIGLAWEEWYIPSILALEGVLDHPEEICLDGIYMSRDGESLDVIVKDNQLVVHEVKATYKSVNTVGDLTKEWMWLAQMKAYCKASGTRFAKLHVLFINGGYQYPLKPKLKKFFVEFTQEELDENWDLIIDYRDERI